MVTRMIGSFDLNEELRRLAVSLDIPDALYELALARYDDVAEWLSREGSPLRHLSPAIYPQGSFRLGTMVRPVGRGGEFDIDLVCRLAVAKESTTQAELKGSVGKRLRAHDELHRILTEQRRCWTLGYPEFHMDVLPAIPDREASKDCILLTDKELRLWQHSNPIGYADWFIDQMRVALEEEQGLLARSTGVSVEEVPYWRVRTPLQRAVQLLKRHRDVHFASWDERRPVSIIITTLAARAYGQQRDVVSALRALVREMPHYIECRNGEWWVPNPANPEENFADKWNEKPERRNAFVTWLHQVGQALAPERFTRSAAGNRDVLMESFGVQSGGSVVASTPALSAVPEVVPDLADTSHVEPIRWPERRAYKCRVRGWVRRTVGSQRSLWELADRPVPKGFALLFQAETNVPKPYEVHWQVVNTGREAALGRDLRGDFYQSDGGHVGRWESTRYAGTHWIEAFVVKDGVCVARSGRKQVRIKR